MASCLDEGARVSFVGFCFVFVGGLPPPNLTIVYVYLLAVYFGRSSRNKIGSEAGCCMFDCWKGEYHYTSRGV